MLSLSSLQPSRFTQTRFPPPKVYSTVIMASAQPSVANTNGSYLQQADPQSFLTNSPAPAPVPNYQTQGSTPQQPSANPESVPKDEVGWYFVEQYYTTLNKTPERLHVSPQPMITGISNFTDYRALYSYFTIKSPRSFGVQKGTFYTLPLVVRCVIFPTSVLMVTADINILTGHPRENPVLRIQGLQSPCF